MAFTAKLTQIYERVESDAFGTGGRTVEYRVGTYHVLNADRHHGQTIVISANLSAYPISFPPLGVSAPGLMMRLVFSQPVDLRLQSATDTVILSAVQMLGMRASISALFVTTSSTPTLMSLDLDGGSAATILMTLPQS